MNKLHTTIAQGRRRQQVNDDCKDCNGLGWYDAEEEPERQHSHSKVYKPYQRHRRQYSWEPTQTVCDSCEGSGKLPKNTKKSKPL